MGKLVIVVAIMIMTMASLGGGIPDDQSPKAVEKWFEKLVDDHPQPTLSKLHFYLHNNFSGSQATIVQVAQAHTTSTPPNRFGSVLVVDALLTVGPDLESGSIGHAQGLLYFTSQQELDFTNTLTFVFRAGKYNGSTLELMGTNPYDKRYREFPIVGGTGDLRLARGICTVQTFGRDEARETLEVDFVFTHY